MIKLDNVAAFDVENYNSWVLGSYVFKCAGNTGYECKLLFGKKSLVKADLSREYDVVDFLPYIYQSETKDYPYEVVLIEAAAERGTAWYYAIVLQNNDVVDSFFIDQGRRHFVSTKEYSDSHPEMDEMYISPEAFISIFADDKKIIFSIDKKYLYANETAAKEGKDSICICKALTNDD